VIPAKPAPTIGQEGPVTIRGFLERP